MFREIIPKRVRLELNQHVLTDPALFIGQVVYHSATDAYCYFIIVRKEGFEPSRLSATSVEVIVSTIPPFANPHSIFIPQSLETLFTDQIVSLLVCLICVRH